MRSLRLSLPDDLYRQIERYARASNTSIAESARYVLAAGVAMVDAMTDPTVVTRR